MLHAFPLLNILIHQIGKYGILASAIFFFSFPKSTAQTEDYKISAMDGEFTMEVSRDNQEVKILMRFRDASQYSYVLVEKTDEIKNEFRQCAYIDIDEEKTKDGIIEKRDRYPRMYNASFYRLRTVTKEGIERTYPAVRLPAKSQ